jgi:serine/threonine-protein kinase
VKLIQPPPSSGFERISAEESDQHLRRFLVEAKTAAAIRSPHVVQILDHGVDPGLSLAYIVMELLDGETLEERLQRRGRLTGDETVRVMGQVAKALSRVHEANLVHRDLKPSNIFLVRNDDEDLVKVLDFGIAKAGATALDEVPITATGQQLGTPVYMSPEQIRGMPDVDFRADLWAFGVIAYECLVGERPFDGETLGDLSLKICAEPIPRPSRVAPLPLEFDDWFGRCVNRERQFTFGSAREAADRLDLALRQGQTKRPASNEGNGMGVSLEAGLGAAFDSTTVAATPTSDLPVLTRSSQLHGTRRWAALAVAVSLLAAAGMAFMSRDEEPAGSPLSSHPTSEHVGAAAGGLPSEVSGSPVGALRSAAAASARSAESASSESVPPLALASERVTQLGTPGLGESTSVVSPPAPSPKELAVARGRGRAASSRSVSPPPATTTTASSPGKPINDLIEDRY